MATSRSSWTGSEVCFFFNGHGWYISLGGCRATVRFNSPSNINPKSFWLVRASVPIDLHYHIKASGLESHSARARAAVMLAPWRRWHVRCWSAGRTARSQGPERRCFMPCAAKKCISCIQHFRKNICIFYMSVASMGNTFCTTEMYPKHIATEICFSWMPFLANLLYIWKHLLMYSVKCIFSPVQGTYKFPFHSLYFCCLFVPFCSTLPCHLCAMKLLNFQSRLVVWDTHWLDDKRWCSSPFLG